MFFNEIRRGFNRKSVILVMLVIIILGILDTFNYSCYKSSDEILNVYLKAYIFSSYDRFILFNSSIYSNILVLSLPILSSLCYSDSYLEDINSGFSNFIHTRKDKGRYLLSKFSANFIVSGIAISIPILFNFIVLLARFPSIMTNKYIGNETVEITQLFPEVYYKHPIIYILMWIAIYFLFTGLFSSISLSLSIFVKNKITVVVLPFIVLQVIGIVLDIFGKYKYYPSSYLHTGLHKDIMIMIVEFGALFVVSFTVFLIGGKKYENI